MTIYLFQEWERCIKIFTITFDGYNIFSTKATPNTDNEIIQHIVVTGIPVKGRNNYYAVFNVKDITELSRKIDDYKTARRKALDEIENRKKIEAKLKKALADKEFLIREVHHRVKNNLALIGSIINLHKMEIQNSFLQTILDDIQGRIRSITLIHEKLYKKSEVTNINLKEYLTTIVDEILGSILKNSSVLTVKYSIEEFTVNPETAIPLGLITTEIVTNSVKYAIMENGENTLSVSLNRKKGGMATLIITDTGPGFPEGMDPETQDSLGFKVIKALTLQLKGQHSISNDGGARHELTFPLTSVKS